MPPNDDIKEAVRRALAVLGSEIENADDLDAIDLDLAESLLCSAETIPRGEAESTRGLRDAIAIVAKRVPHDLTSAIDAADALHEKKRACRYGGEADDGDVVEAEEARSELYASLEIILDDSSVSGPINDPGDEP